MPTQLLSKIFNRGTLIWVASATLISGAIAAFGISQFTSTPSHNERVSSIPIRQVTALGRLEPATEVIRVSVPQTLDSDRVANLLVQQGDRVKAGQVIAILNAHDRLQTALQETQERVYITTARLIKIKAGVQSGALLSQQATIARFQAEQQGELATQAATIARWQSEVRNAQVEYSRYRQLHQEGAIAASTLDAKRLTLETTESQLNEAIATKQRIATTSQAQIREARANYDQVAEVRPIDVQIAQAEVNEAIAAVKRAEAELAEATVRAPIAGRILKIHTRAGEKIDTNGIVELGQTDQMVAIAEVYQTDIGKVQIGQQATLTSPTLAKEVQGTVVQIGSQVNRQTVISQQPGENLDRRVIEVKILLTPTSSKQVENLTNLQLQIAIHL
jgi:HlyD family secretion protein